LLLGEVLPTIAAGNFLLQQIRGVAAEGGLNPSMTGELLLNFRAIGVIFGMMLFGMALKLIYIPVQSGRASQAGIALFSFSLWVVATSVVFGSAGWFRLLVFAIPIMLVHCTVPRVARPGAPQRPRRRLKYRRGGSARNGAAYELKH